MKLELTQKEWDWIATIMLILCGLYWVVMSEYGIIFQITGFIFYYFFGIVCIYKTSWVKLFKSYLINLAQNENDM